MLRFMTKTAVCFRLVSICAALAVAACGAPDTPVVTEGASRRAAASADASAAAADVMAAARPTAPEASPSGAPSSAPPGVRGVEGGDTSGDDPAVVELIPLAARPGTPAGAAAFARFYVESANHAFVVGDPTWLDGWADPECVGCARWTRIARKLKARDAYTTMEPFRVDEARPTGVQSGVTQRVIVTLYQRSYGVASRRTGHLLTAKRSPSYEADMMLTLRYDGRWHVVSAMRLGLDPVDRAGAPTTPATSTL